MSDLLARRATQLQRALEGDELAASLTRAATEVADALAGSGTVLAAGNGGSAAQADHVVAELVGRLRRERDRGPLRAISLASSPSIVTALTNDYGADEVFARLVQGIGRERDVLLALSTSGRSENLVRAVAAAGRAGITTIGLLGAGDAPLHLACDLTVVVAATDPGTVQEAHLVLIHALVELVEDRLAELNALA